MRAIFLVFVVFAGAGTLLASWLREGQPAPAQPDIAVPKPALIRVSNGAADSKSGGELSSGVKPDGKSQPAALPLVTMSGKVEPPVKTVAVVNAPAPPVAPEPAAAAIVAPVADQPAPPAPAKPVLTVTCVAGCGDKNGQPVFQREISAEEHAAALAAPAVPVETSPRSRRVR